MFAHVRAPRAGHRKGVVLASTIMVSCLAVASCSSQSATDSEPEQQVASNTALNADWQKDNFGSFYEQSVDWRKCTADDGLDDQLSELLTESGVDAAKFQCGTVKAPMNWADPHDERTVDLAVIRIPSNNNRDDAVPMFNNPGGPGVGGVQNAILLSSNAAFANVLDNHELWGFDPRGVGNSSPVTCDYDSELPVVTLAECAKDHELAHYMGTSQVARDMELLRYLTGDKRLDYIGYSYGTMLGATYATLFPDKAGRMILDSAETSQWATLPHLYDQAVSTTKAITELAIKCPSLRNEDDKPVQCPFSTERELIDFKKQLDDKPLKATDGTEIKGVNMRTFLTTALYTIPSGQAQSLDLLGRAKSGDQKAIDELADQIANNSAEIDTAGQLIVCPSSPKDPDIPGLIDHMEKTGVPELLGGPKVTDELLEEYTELDCTVLPETGTDIQTDFNAADTAEPLLVVGITGDHATPFQHGKELAKQLGNAAFLTVEGFGHGATFTERSACADKIATDYLVNGKVPQPDTVCGEE